MKKLTFIFVALAFIALSVILSGCASLEHKSVAIGSSVDAFKIETSGSLSSGNLLPNIIFGGAVNSFATAPIITIEPGKEQASQVVYVKTRRSSFFGQLFGINAATESISYIGAIGESVDDTERRCKALSSLSTIEPSQVKTASE